MLAKILAGMGLSVEAGLLVPIGKQVGHYWACLCLFGIEATVAWLLVLFWGRAIRRRSCPRRDGN